MITLTEQGLIEKQDLRKEVEKAILEILEEAELTGKTVFLQDLSQQLHERFRGKPLAARLEMSLPAFVRSIEGVVLTGDSNKLVVKQYPELAFGRLPSTNSQKTSNTSGEIVQNDLFQMVKRLILKWVQEALVKGQDIEIGEMANRLALSLPGQGQLAQRLGYKTF
jgi:hypothetical protein